MCENEVREACEECTRKCRQFVCCICSRNGVCECSTVWSDEED